MDIQSQSITDCGSELTAYAELVKSQSRGTVGPASVSNMQLQQLQKNTFFFSISRKCTFVYISVNNSIY